MRLAALPAGPRMVEIGERLLQNVSGAIGRGWLCSFTSECPGNLGSKIYRCM